MKGTSCTQAPGYHWVKYTAGGLVGGTQGVAEGSVPTAQLRSARGDPSLYSSGHNIQTWTTAFAHFSGLFHLNWAPWRQTSYPDSLQWEERTLNQNTVGEGERATLSYPQSTCDVSFIFATEVDVHCGGWGGTVGHFLRSTMQGSLLWNFNFTDYRCPVVQMAFCLPPTAFKMNKKVLKKKS